MVVDATIAQLRAACPPLGGRVAGAADFQLGLRNYNENMPLPAAYVVPLDQASPGNQVMTGLIQVVEKTIGVIVEFDARPDRRGQAPVMNYDAMETALFGALLNWQPAVCATLNQQGYWFSGGRFLDLDRARLFYQWEFALAWQLTDADAWSPEAVDLVGIELDLYSVPPPMADQVAAGSDPAAIVKIDTLAPGPEQGADQETPP
jgi:hypothetical protein